MDEEASHDASSRSGDAHVYLVYSSFVRFFVLQSFCGLGLGFQMWVMMASSANPTLTPSFALPPPLSSTSVLQHL